jgi:hypothetical protein
MAASLDALVKSMAVKGGVGGGKGKKRKLGEVEGEDDPQQRMRNPLADEGGDGDEGAEVA